MMTQIKLAGIAFLVTAFAVGSASASNYRCSTEDQQIIGEFEFGLPGRPTVVSLIIQGQPYTGQGQVEDWNSRGADGFFAQYVLPNGNEYLFSGKVKTGPDTLSGSVAFFSEGPMISTPITCSFTE